MRACDCPHCKQAAKLVKERQQVSQRLSVAKRHIDRVGRASA
jgi:glutaredoxin